MKLNQPQTLIAQELIDLTFSIAGMISDPEYYGTHFCKMTHAERMEWVAKQLAACGYPTQPMGASWGVLKREASEPATFRPEAFEIVSANRPE